MPLSDSVRFVDTLDYVQQMFMAAASQKPEEYKKAETLYRESFQNTREANHGSHQPHHGPRGEGDSQ